VHVTLIFDELSCLKNTDRFDPRLISAGVILRGQADNAQEILCKGVAEANKHHKYEWKQLCAGQAARP
jgi:hypothetical protein